MKNVFYSFKPFYNFAKLLGLFPLTFHKNSFSVSWIDLLLSSVAALFLVTMTVLTVCFAKGPVMSSSMMPKIWRIHSTLSLFQVVIQFGIQMKISAKAVPRFLFKLQKFDDKVSFKNKLVFSKKVQYKVFWCSLNS